MFKKKSPQAPEPPVSRPAPATAPTPAPAPRPATVEPKPMATTAPVHPLPKPTVVPDPKPVATQASKDSQTIIGPQIFVDGIIRGKENLVVDGAMKGKILLEKHQFTVGPNGKVDAEIMADNVTISGQLVGNIVATGTVKITKEADFSGEIKANSISVEDGAYLKATIELTRQPHKPMTAPAPGLGIPKPAPTAPKAVEAKPAEAVKPTAPPKPTEPNKPMEPAKPVEPPKPVDFKSQVKPAAPVPNPGAAKASTSVSPMAREK